MNEFTHVQYYLEILERCELKKGQFCKMEKNRLRGVGKTEMHVTIEAS